jgi:hypothetical protein
MKLIAAIAMLSMSLSLCGLSEKLGNKGNSNGSSNSNDSSSTKKSGSTSDADAPPPEMTSAQKAALEGGQQVVWEGKGLNWTIPAKWTKVNVDENTLQYKSPGAWDAGFLIVNISNLGADFPVEISTKAIYDGDATRKQAGEILSYRYLALDGVKGIEDIEAEKSNKEDARRLEWRGYRKRNGLVQLITIIMSSQSQHFPKHDDELHAILYSTKIEKE